MKLSLPVLFDDDEREYDTPCYLVHIEARFTSRVSEDMDWRSESVALRETIRAALAQQGQPRCKQCGKTPDDPDHFWQPDRPTHGCVAAPQPEHCPTCGCVGRAWRLTGCKDEFHAQQPQEPMMPVREHEYVAQAMATLLAEVDALRAALRAVSQPTREQIEALRKADRDWRMYNVALNDVLALYGKSEAKCCCGKHVGKSEPTFPQGHSLYVCGEIVPPATRTQ